MQKMLVALALLAVLPASAQTPPSSHNETIFLRHATPANVVEQMHWDDAANLPKGVKFVAADTKHNALIVRADAAGTKKVREIVSILDIEPRTVEIHGYFARVTGAELDATGIDFDTIPLTNAKDKPISYARIASGDVVNVFLKTLSADKSRIRQSPIIRTTNNFPAMISVNSAPADAPRFRSTLSVNPRINNDNSLTLVIKASSGPADAELPSLTTLRTLKQGEPLLLFGGLQDADGSPLALFLTAAEPTDKPVKP